MQVKCSLLNIYQLCFTRLPFRRGGLGGGLGATSLGCIEIERIKYDK